MSHAIFKTLQNQWNIIIGGVNAVIVFSRMAMAYVTTIVYCCLKYAIINMMFDNGFERILAIL